MVLLDLRNLVDYADVFVLCTAGNRRQVQAIADEVKRVAKDQHTLRPLGVEGVESARWVLVDFGDVVVHVFADEVRAYYEIERLYRDVPRLEWQATAPDPA